MIWNNRQQRMNKVRVLTKERRHDWVDKLQQTRTQLDFLCFFFLSRFGRIQLNSKRLSHHGSSTSTLRIQNGMDIHDQNQTLDALISNSTNSRNRKALHSPTIHDHDVTAETFPRSANRTSCTKTGSISDNVTTTPQSTRTKIKSGALVRGHRMVNCVQTSDEDVWAG